MPAILRHDVQTATLPSAHADSVASSAPRHAPAHFDARNSRRYGLRAIEVTDFPDDGGRTVADTASMNARCVRSRIARGVLLGFGVMLILAVAVAHAGMGAQSFSDHFTKGIDPSTWKVTKTQKLYVVSTKGGAVRLSTPGGGAGGFQWVGLQFRHQFRGNFDVSIRYSGASLRIVSGSPANQVQLNAELGGHLFCVVRDDTTNVGDNYHVWTTAWNGQRPTSATAGVLRIVRLGSTVTGYADGVALYRGSFGAAPVTKLWMSLQNNGTTDPIAVTFDDFTLRADAIA